MLPISYTFTKAERLCSPKLISYLFKKPNHSCFCSPIRAIWKLNPTEATTIPLQILISVPKKQYKKAVDRNYLKRCIREAFRLHKHIVYDTLITNNQSIILTCVVQKLVDKPPITYQSIETSMVDILTSIHKHYYISH